MGVEEAPAGLAARAGLVHSSRGPNGGYSLARRPSEISLWDVRLALDGPGPDFRCQEIRRRGPCPSRKPESSPCTIAAAFWDAERAYRERLQRTTIADIVGQIAAEADPERAARFFTWLNAASG